MEDRPLSMEEERELQELREKVKLVHQEAYEEMDAEDVYQLTGVAKDRIGRPVKTASSVESNIDDDKLLSPVLSPLKMKQREVYGSPKRTVSPVLGVNKEKEESEKKNREEQEKEAAEKKVKEEAERKIREEAEKKENELKEIEERKRKEKEEAERILREGKEKEQDMKEKEKEEREMKAKEEREKNEREEKEKIEQEERKKKEIEIEEQERIKKELQEKEAKEKIEMELKEKKEKEKIEMELKEKEAKEKIEMELKEKEAKEKIEMELKEKEDKEKIEMELKEKEKEKIEMELKEKKEKEKIEMELKEKEEKGKVADMDKAVADQSEEMAGQQEEQAVAKPVEKEASVEAERGHGSGEEEEPEKAGPAVVKQIPETRAAIESVVTEAPTIDTEAPTESYDRDETTMDDSILDSSWVDTQDDDKSMATEQIEPLPKEPSSVKTPAGVQNKHTPQRKTEKQEKPVKPRAKGGRPQGRISTPERKHVRKEPIYIPREEMQKKKAVIRKTELTKSPSKRNVMKTRPTQHHSCPRRRPTEALPDSRQPLSVARKSRDRASDGGSWSPVKTAPVLRHASVPRHASTLSRRPYQEESSTSITSSGSTAPRRAT
ncbi:Microtubule-associated protein 2 [Liparis tanakae]|uniref:Microtubule-associated protein 2 n=1 Tax=Liparis tanakae TaxID=230148 RepID=A0A4Z2IHH7_9TELE|nr:Microtubule-associated protein 2 [Liparis tanakae]